MFGKVGVVDEPVVDGYDNEYDCNGKHFSLGYGSDST